ncbi:hypothetical protein BDZ94DRAFT_1156518 [Collybia nuda]|uniref:Uncharacterized protein n=1 Tax=Collybia nuda TaxID=64659 RepID=A0A9P5YEI6_9AGAR|nr:hypothetical protein BDZ94DRAFT_1156518 [Collybia nuda]
MPQQSRASFHYAQPPALPPAEAPLPPRNERELTREMLFDILTFFSTLIPSRFNGAPVRLVVHGGACMLLHPGLYALAQQQPPPSPSNSPHKTLLRRTTTRDVDYINRSFAYEWHNMGVPDATERLKDCMKITAQKFRLGLDWMNSDADVALPMANDPATGQRYDPIYTAALKPNNVSLHTVFTSPNGMLTLVSVTPFWSVALKLVRYTKWDPGDICLLLRLVVIFSWKSMILAGPYKA